VLIAPFVPQLVRESAREAFATFDRPPIADNPLADAQRAEAVERRAGGAADARALDLDDGADGSDDEGEYLDDDDDFDDDDDDDDDDDLLTFGAEPEAAIEMR
jgi:hypothetical protein